jgi:hypothetical protein
VGDAPEVHVSLVGRRDLAGEIHRQLRRAILDGRLLPGGRLPPTRELARRLSVSRTTVAVAYDRLTGEGFVTARVGAGTFVSEAAGPRGRPRPAGGALRPRPAWGSITVPTVFDRPATFDFRPGVPDARLFPYQTWRRLLAQQLRPDAVGDGTYGDPAGHPGLRQAIARHVGASRAVQAGPGQVVVANGTQQAVDLVARVLLEPGDRVAVETPGYGPPRRLLTSLGAEVVGVPVDAEGLVVEAIPPGVRLVTVSPSHQFPLGMAMSLPRRLALLAWAERCVGPFTTASSATAAGRSSPCRPWTRAAGSCTWGRSPRPCWPPCASGSWSCPSRWSPRSGRPSSWRTGTPPCPSRPPWPGSSTRATWPATSAACAWDAGTPSQPGFALGYGAIGTDRIEEGLARLRRCFDG